MAVNGGKLDEAARAAWLYYVAGNTQDQIAAKLGVSRQSAQRLVSLAVSEGLVKVHIDYPIAHCLDLSKALREAYGLSFCEVVPTDPDSRSTTLGIAQATAAEIERWLKRQEPLIMAIGTGRTLRAAVEQLSTMECPQHRIVSLTGNIAPDGSAAYYNVVFTMADKVKARFFPMPLPVIASSKEEREALHAQPMIRSTLALADEAAVSFVGIGELDGDDAPLYVDGFITLEELRTLRAAGAVTEIVGWTFDADGRLIEGMTNERVASAPLPSSASSLVIASAMGRRKLPGIRIALKGKIVNGLVTDEATAEALLA
ncbi:sugar-binding transcriptional regulator [Chelativorans salis]|uniref:Sugar-binding transcriptional regulator n=1 Tax=Chelativorans salis TaxID=2978478 RepID=A0ABT2LUG7_9HYPH|nr:sugar-binding transcriptional regulator [Chelativorans sp. EGI FJ00035]MCT7378171.1 sugar-binding transcriptional regulator [Chelativorans sp. EGI FJ00035]